MFDSGEDPATKRMILEWGTLFPELLPRKSRSIQTRPRILQPIAKIPRPRRIAFFAVERRAHQFLQMGRLRVQEEFVDLRHGNLVEQAEVDAEADAGEQVHR